jgi:hypothetical protein
MELRAGMRMRSVVCQTEVIVVKAPSGAVELRCGGQPMVSLGEEGSGGEPVAPYDGGTMLGKRYADEETGLEVLCTKAGSGALSLGDVVLAIKEAKPLPSSD